jgi:hypothetical protein
MPPQFFLHSLQVTTTLLRMFRRHLNLFHELVVQTIYSSVCLCYNAWVVSKVFGPDLDPDAPVDADSAEEEEAEEEEAVEEEDPEDAAERRRARTAARDNRALFFSPVLAPPIIAELCRYVAHYVRLIYHHGYPRRALDLKMCGILLLVSTDDAPPRDRRYLAGNRSRPPKPTDTQWTPHVAVPIPSLPASSPRMLVPEAPVYSEGIALLQNAFDEGKGCFGEDHHEMRQIQEWLAGGWRKLWHYKRRSQKAALLHARQQTQQAHTEHKQIAPPHTPPLDEK